MSGENVSLINTPDGLTLLSGTQQIRGDFTRMLPRLKEANLRGEMLVKAAKVKNTDALPVALDATAGLGEDSLLLAAAGYQVEMYERDEVIAALLEDAMRRGLEDPRLAPAISRMRLHCEDSVQAMRQMYLHCEDSVQVMRQMAVQGSLPSEKRGSCLTESMGSPEEQAQKETAQEMAVPVPGIILLDPMFPARTKSAQVKKKFQLIHQLERPCEDEEELLEAAIALHPRKIIIKRPLKGPFLAGVKPSYSIKGKAIRYDCIVQGQKTDL